MLSACTGEYQAAICWSFSYVQRLEGAAYVFYASQLLQVVRCSRSSCICVVGYPWRQGIAPHQLNPCQETVLQSSGVVSRVCSVLQGGMWLYHGVCVHQHIVASFVLLSNSRSMSCGALPLGPLPSCSVLTRLITLVTAFLCSDGPQLVHCVRHAVAPPAGQFAK
jgi:hypothetical protein